MLLLQNTLSLLLGFLETLIIIDVILSWIYRGNNGIVTLIHGLTAPLLLPGKKLQQMIIPDMPVDFSPIIAFAILRLLESFVRIIL